MAALAVLSMSGRGLSRGVFLVICFGVVSSFSVIYGFRDSASGTDSAVYAAAFELAQFHRWEPGYVVWLAFLRSISASYEVYFSLETILKLLLLAWASYNLSKVVGYLLGALFLVSLTYSFTLFDLYTNGLRQGFAMTLAVVSLALLLRGRFKSSLVFAALSPFFHLSYVLFFVIYLVGVSALARSRVFFDGAIVGSAASVALLALGVSLVNTLEPAVLGAGRLLGAEGKVNHYMSATRGSFSELNVVGRLSIIFVLSMSAAALLYVKGRVGLRGGSVLVMVALLIIAYSALAFSAYSYRVLYIVTAFLPFVLVIVMSSSYTSTTGALVVRLMPSVWLLVVSINYIYFVVVRGGLREFEYLIG
ncbi:MULTISPECIES: EpsG family protein [unclassified Thioalkalivibrio]|uniref:EpsG family protein n=1 Tax=unclassified Thioalkalivibrio TaxID=2621013 RepID=UPI001E58A53A|nr:MULTISPECIES: EpsG family protein [unclassified Thioalkalivibrio]